MNTRPLVKLKMPLVLSLCRCFNTSSIYLAVTSPSAKLLGGKQPDAVSKKMRLPPETDPQKLVKYVCGSDYRKENPQDIEIKDDSEYPDWLWEVRLDKPPSLSTMEPNSIEYWKRMSFQLHLQNERIKETKDF